MDLHAKVNREQTWKAVSAGTGILGALITKRLMRAGYEAFRRDHEAPSPFDPTNVQFSWLDVMVWAIAAGIGLGIAKVVSARVAAVGWEAATGSRPPGFRHRRGGQATDPSVTPSPV